MPSSGPATLAARDRVLRSVEAVVLFVGIPAALYFDALPIPNIAALGLAMAFGLFLLLLDPSYRKDRLWKTPAWKRELRRMFKRVVPVGVFLILAAHWLAPERLWAFPRQTPWTWFWVMVIYPVCSAFPQELLYRALFLHRYSALFPHPRTATWLSAAGFALMHVIYHNPVAVILSFLGGLLFLNTYLRSYSVPIVALEHAIYGNMLFTVGLGRYFLSG